MKRNDFESLHTSRVSEIDDAHGYTEYVKYEKKNEEKKYEKRKEKEVGDVTFCDLALEAAGLGDHFHV